MTLEISAADRRRAERRVAPSFRWVERRSGYDRRASSGWEARLARLSQSLPLSIVVVGMFVMLSAFDMASTEILVDRGATELNPLVRSWMEAGVAWTAKLSVAVTVGASLIALRRYRVAAMGMLVAVGLMAAIAAYHAVHLLAV